MGYRVFIAKNIEGESTDSPEDKRKIVQIDDTSTKFRTLDPLQVGNDLR